MDKSFLENLQHGNVIKYRVPGESDYTYLVVKKVENGKIKGHISLPIDVNSVSIDKILETEELSIAEFKPLKPQ